MKLIPELLVKKPKILHVVYWLFTKNLLNAWQMEAQSSTKKKFLLEMYIT